MNSSTTAIVQRDQLMHSLAGLEGNNCLGPGHRGTDPDKAEKLCKALDVWRKSPRGASVGGLVWGEKVLGWQVRSQCAVDQPCTENSHLWFCSDGNNSSM